MQVKYLLSSLLMTVLAFTIWNAALAQGASSADAYNRLGSGKWSMRITNPADAGRKLCARVYFNPNQHPWSGDTIYIGQGGEQQDIPPREQWLEPGQSSDWVDIGVHMPGRSSFGGAASYLAPVFIGAMCEPEAKDLRLVVELAKEPGRRIARTITVFEINPTLMGYLVWLSQPPKVPTQGLLVPVNTSSEQQIVTLEEAAEQQLRWIKECGATPEPPKHIWFISHQKLASLKNPSRLERLNIEIIRQLGYGNLTDYASDSADIDAIRAMGDQPTPAKLERIWDSSIPDAVKNAKEAGVWDYVRGVSLGDEICLASKQIPAEEQDQEFISYLKGKGFKPLDFVRPEDEAAAAGKPESEQWDYVHLAGPLPAQKPKLLYVAATFRFKLWGRKLGERTSQAKEGYPKGTEVGANFSPHLSVWPYAPKWISIFRDGGMTMPWSEDWWWQAPEASPQTYGYLLGALRLAAGYHNGPIAFYTIPDVGVSAEDLLRMNYFALGNQVKVIDHFCISNQAACTCDYIDYLESKDKFAAIHRILTDVSKVDERLHKARMRPAETAILVSSANDVWNTENILSDTDQAKAGNMYHADLNVDNHERKALWLALRHSHIPVDLITDEDVAEGKLSKYKVLYLVGQEIVQQAAPALERWVRKGGVLISSGGGGLLNEYREPIPSMSALYGLAGSDLQRPIRSIGPASDLPKTRSMDTITLKLGKEQLSLPALCYKQTFKLDEKVDILGSYNDGTPAAVSRKIGKGKVILLGSLPGMAYLQPAMLARKGHAEDYPNDVRRLIAGWAESAGVKKPVITSDPLVEATLQEGPLGPVVTLVSFRNKPVDKVTVTLPGLPKAKKVTSLRHGTLNVSRTKNGPTVSLPVDQGDFLVVD